MLLTTSSDVKTERPDNTRQNLQVFWGKLHRSLPAATSAPAVSLLHSYRNFSLTDSLMIIIYFDVFVELKSFFIHHYVANA